jgi:hypothetical protein
VRVLQVLLPVLLLLPLPILLMLPLLQAVLFSTPCPLLRGQVAVVVDNERDDRRRTGQCEDRNRVDVRRRCPMPTRMLLPIILDAAANDAALERNGQLSGAGVTAGASVVQTDGSTNRWRR